MQSYPESYQDMNWQQNNQQYWYGTNYQAYNANATTDWSQGFNYANYYPSGWNFNAPNFNMPPPGVPPPTPDANLNPPLPPGQPPLPPDPPPGEPPKESDKEDKKEPKVVPVVKSSPVVAPPPENISSNYIYNQPPPPIMAYPPPQIPAVQNSPQPTAVIKFNLMNKKPVDTHAKNAVPANGQQDFTSNGTSANPWGNTKKEKSEAATNNLGSSMEDWPASLKSYVERCFARCKTDLDKDQVEICLKGKLTMATNNHTIRTKDWDKEALISIHSQSPLKPKKFDSKNFQGDPTRGFSVTRKSPNGKQRKRSSSAESEKDFIPVVKKKGNKKNLKSRLGKKDTPNQSQFYSKHGNAFAAEESFSSSVKLEERAARFANSKKRQGPTKQATPAKRKRLNLQESINNAFTVDDDSIDLSSMHIVGTSLELEKRYLRLTSAPDPSSVRTLPTLRKALEHAKKEWKKSQDYRATCDRMKSIRQDLTVQGIRDDFTVHVYETHCRIALEANDVEEYNQCQSQLKQLYGEVGGPNRLEFTAYRLLYYVFTKNTLDITSLMAGLSKQDKENPCVSFALSVRAAWALSNYHKLFDLYKNSPLMTGYLMDWFCERERKLAIKILVKSYRPSVESSFIRNVLAIDSDEDWNTFVAAVGLPFTDASRKVVDTKSANLTC